MRFLFLLTLVCVMFSGAHSQEKKTESVIITIPLQKGQSVAMDDLVIGIPVCKYDKQFAFTFTGDDALLGIYSRAFNYIWGNYVDDDPIFHEEIEERTTGINPSRQLTYSDGCGNRIPFRLATNWQSSKVGRNIHENGNKWVAQMWWSEAERFTDFCNGILNHGGDVENQPDSSIRKTMYGVADTLGIYPFVHGIPGGTSGFPEAGEANPDVYFMEAGRFGSGNVSLAALTNESLWKGRFPRNVLDGITDLDVLKKRLEENLKKDHWANFFCHNIKNATSFVNGQFNTDVCFAMLDYLYDMYGLAGKDNIWFASSPEVLEYSYTRLNSVVKASIENGNLVIRIQMGFLPHFYFKDLTLKLAGLGNVELKGLTFSSNVYGASYTSSNGEGLINFCTSDFKLNRAEKYVALLEEQKTPSALREARFFVDGLVSPAAAAFKERLSSVVIVDDLNGVEYVWDETSANSFSLYSSKGELIISGCLKKPLMVHRVDGQCIHICPLDGMLERKIKLAPGIYVVDGASVLVQ